MALVDFYSNIIIASTFSGLGHEELAKRGCGTSDLSTLDSDLRARHVSAEELSLAAGVQYRKPVNLQAPATWWDRNCDIALLIGAFVHGLGNYEAMRNDEDLPFAHHMRVYAESDEASCAANRAFQAAAFAAKVVFEEALERAKAKAAYEVQAAVAAAAATASEREQDAVALRLGGAAADAVLSNLPDLPEEPMATKRSTVDDLHFITLPRLQEAIIKYARKDYHEVVARPVTTEVVPVSVESENGKVKSENGTVKSGESKEVTSAVVSEEAVVAEDNLPMPDSRVLNRRFIEILNEVEANLDNQKTEYDISEAGNRWEANQYVLTNREIRSKALSSLFVSEDDLKNVLSEYSGVGISGAQCGSTHRSLDDGSDFSVGSASPDLGQIAHGTDAPRYLRALGVPMNVTRFAITALVYADSSTVLQMLENERLRNNMRDKSKEKSPKRGKAPNKLTADQTPSKTPNSSFAGDESNVVNGTKPKKETDAKVDFPPSDKNGSAHEIIEQAKVKSSADPTEKNTKLELVSTSKEIKREPASMIENEPNPPRTATENDTKSPSQLIEDTKNQEAKLASNWLEEKEAIKLRSHAVEENPPTNSNVEAAKTPSDSVDGSKEVPNSVENDVKPKSIPDSVPEKSLSDSVKTEDNLTFDKLSNPVGGGEPNVKSDPGDVPMSDATEADAKIESNSGDVPMPDAVEGDVKIESDPGDVPITDAVERGPKPDQADLLQPDTVETYVKPKSEQTLPNDTDDKSESAEKDRKTTPLDSAKQVVSEYTDATLPQESENTTKSPQSTADKRDEKDGKSSSKSTDKKHDPSSSKANAGTDSPVAPSPKDPAELVLSPFKDNARLRAAVSSTVLLYGYPSLKTSTSTSSVAKSLWISVREQGGALDEKEPASLFNMKTFVNRIQSFIPGEPLPDTQAIQDYVEKTLLPHCLRLSIFGNGPCTRNARGSKGKYETALGISHYPEPSKEVQSPLPDPCLPLGEQSLEAVAYSCAILRRVRLMRAAQHVATGNISVEDLEQVARSSFMCKNLDGLPLWWCPWVHDVALLVHASTNGLFSIVQNHHNDLSAGVFSRKAIVHTMYSTFFADEKMLPKTIVDQFEQDDANEWIKLHAKDFPTANVLERRLAFLCSQATKSDEGELRYDNLPMFDHGGWPRA